MKKFTFLLLLLAALSVTGLAQLSIDAASTDYTISFDATVTDVSNGQFQGAGFQPTPTAGQLDSDAWATTGMSDGPLSFGGTNTSGDHARGTSSGGTSTGGFYAFDIGSGNYIIGVQPGGSDWTPGTVTLKLVNNTGSTITSLDVEYDIEEYNDQGRANSLNFSHSSDDVSYTSVPALDHTTVEAAAPSPGWVNFNKSTTLTGLSIVDGANYYLRWSGNDVSGSGSRDEYGFHNIVVNATTGTANSSDSDIVKTSGWSEPTNIDYRQYAVPSGLTTSNAIEVGKFTIRDGGATAPDADSESTTLTSLTFSINNFSEIEALALFDGTTNVSEETSITASTSFSGISGLSAADDGTKDFSVYATFKTNVTDNANLKFTIISASADGTGSTFAASDAGGAETDDTGDNNKLVVIADRLAITAPVTVFINTDFSVEVEATDRNGTRDLDENTSVTLAKATGTGTLSSITGLTQSLSSGYYGWTDLQYDVVEIFTIVAQSGTLTDVTSGNIVAKGEPYTELLISEVTDPNDVANAKYVEIYNAGSEDVDFVFDTWYLSRQANGGSWGNIQLTGSVNSGETYVVANSQSIFTTQYGFEADKYSGTISGNGDDGYFLYFNGDNSTGTLIDAYGVIDEDGSGKAWEYLNTKAVRLRSVTSPTTTWTASEWDIPGSANVDDMTPDAHNEDVTWAGGGTEADDWHEKGANWSGAYGYVPDVSSNVTIPSTTVSPIISDEAACYDLTLNEDAILDVAVGGELTVYNDLDMFPGGRTRGASAFTIKSTASGNGSVIIHGLTGEEVTVERYIPAYTSPGDGWHLVAPPVDFFTVDGSDFDPGANDDLYKWNEFDNKWENHKAHPEFTSMDASEGYLVAFETTAVRDFYGYLTNIDWPITNLTVTAGKGEGWHLLGNPFTSAIEWGTTDWGLTNVGGVAQIWDDAIGNYTLINQGDPIPSTNGFFVEASVDASNSITIPAAARIHDSQNNYKNGAAELFDETLVLSITNDENMYTDLTRIGFKQGAIEAYDLSYDAHKLFGNNKAPQLWSVNGSDHFAQSFLPYSSEEYPVTINFRAGVNGTYHINANGLNSFYQGTDIFLEDLFMDKIIDLNEQSMYTFTATTDDDEARFILHFYGITSTGDIPASNDAKIYAYQNTVYVQLNDHSTSVYEVEVVNIVGQQIYSNEFISGGLNSFKLNEKPGIYFVQLHAENKTMVQKIMISN